MAIIKKPFRKLFLASSFATGYVLGAQAGRERYDQIVGLVSQVKQDPRVQDATSTAQTFVNDKAGEAVSTAQSVINDKTVVDLGSSDTSGDTDTDTASDNQDAAADTAAAAAAPVGSVPTPSEVAARAAAATTGSADTATAAPVDDEVVYSSGPDIEESVEELSSIPEDER